MNESGDWCWTCHGIRQPHEKRKLGGFASHTEKHEEGDEEHDNGFGGSHRCSLGEDLVKLQGAEIGENEEHGDEQSKIADAVGDEGFLGGDGIADAVLALLEPEADEQVGAQAHAFPADEHHQEVIGADQDHHGGDEEVEVNKETGVAPGIAIVAHIIVHVADGVDVDEHTHTGDHQHHHHREGIHAECPAGGEITNGDPIPEDER